jgi:hypothetical protein
MPDMSPPEGTRAAESYLNPFDQATRRRPLRSGPASSRKPRVISTSDVSVSRSILRLVWIIWGAMWGVRMAAAHGILHLRPSVADVPLLLLAILSPGGADSSSRWMEWPR